MVNRLLPKPAPTLPGTLLDDSFEPVNFALPQPPQAAERRRVRVPVDAVWTTDEAGQPVIDSRYPYRYKEMFEDEAADFMPARDTPVAFNPDRPNPIGYAVGQLPEAARGPAAFLTLPQAIGEMAFNASQDKLVQQAPILGKPIDEIDPAYQPLALLAKNVGHIYAAPWALAEGMYHAAKSGWDAYTDYMEGAPVNARALNQASFDLSSLAPLGVGAAKATSSAVGRAADAGDLGVFAGRRAAGNFEQGGRPGPRMALDLADALERSGFSADEIALSATAALREVAPEFGGVSKGADGQWRFEIDDSASQIAPGYNADVGRFERLPDILDHPALYEAYPELRQAYGQARIGDDYSGSMEMGGAIDPATDARGPLFEAVGRDPEELRSVMLHEAEHFAQAREGFAAGSNPEIFRRGPNMQRENLAPMIAKFETESGQRFADMPRDQQKALMDALALDLYTREAGEVEARNVQGRRDMSPAERRAWTPEMTQDTPVGEQVIVDPALLREDFPDSFRPEMAAGRRELDSRGFYSPSLEAAKGLKQQSGTVQQFRAQILKNGGKPKELEAVGFDKAFPDPNAKVTRQEIEDFLRANRVELGEKRFFGNEPHDPQIDRDGRPQYLDDGMIEHTFTDRDSGDQYIVTEDKDAGNVYVQGPGGRFIEVAAPVNRQRVEDGISAIHAHLRKKLTEDANLSPDGPATFESYSTPGGIPGSYREVVTTIPERYDIEARRLEAERDAILEEYANSDIPAGQARLDAARADPRYMANLDAQDALTVGMDYTSSHWPGVTNPLLHYRVKDFEGASASGLRVEESVGDGGVRRFAFFDGDREVGSARMMGDTLGDIEVMPELRRQGYGEQIAREMIARGARNWNAVTPESQALFEKISGPQKTRLLDELQSDWGQRARDQGTRSPEQAASLSRDLDSARRELGEAIGEGKDLLQRLHDGDAAVAAHINSRVAASGVEDINTLPPANTRALLNEIYSGDMVRSGPLLGDILSASNKIAGLQDKIMDLGNKVQAAESGVPSAPFISNTSDWVDLGLKQVLVDAARDPSVSRLAWTPGDVQAQRYGMERHVDEISVERNPADGVRYVGIHIPQRGEAVFHVAPDGVIKSAAREEFQGAVGRPLSELVGGELADRLMAVPDAEVFDGGALRVGGEGHKKFYGTMSPEGYQSGIVGTRLQKLVKSLDPEAARIEPFDTNPRRGEIKRELGKGEYGNPYPSIEITPALRQKILDEGLSLFANKEDLALITGIVHAAESEGAGGSGRVAPQRMYRGDYRADRMGKWRIVDEDEGGSGGIYLTDNPEIASNYATGKNYIDDEWWSVIDNAKMPDGKKLSDVKLNAKQRVGVDSAVLNWKNVDGESPIGRRTWDDYLQRNGYDRLKAAEDVLLNGGVMDRPEFEAFLQDVNQKLGIAPNAFFDNPAEARPAVSPVYLNSQKPFDVRAATERDLKKIEKLVGKDDQTLWMLRLARETGDSETITTVTPAFREALIKLGYDSIKDIGGEITGGDHHNVSIAIKPGTVRSATSGETLFVNDERAALAAAGGISRDEAIHIGKGHLDDYRERASRLPEEPEGFGNWRIIRGEEGNNIIPDGPRILREARESGLPMGDEDRLARAYDQGFDLVVPGVHGTRGDPFAAFDPRMIGHRDMGHYGSGHYFVNRDPDSRGPGYGHINHGYGEASYYGDNLAPFFLQRGKTLDLLGGWGGRQGYGGSFPHWGGIMDEMGILDPRYRPALEDLKRADELLKTAVVQKYSDGTYQAHVIDPDTGERISGVAPYHEEGPTTPEGALKLLENQLPRSLLADNWWNWDIDKKTGGYDKRTPWNIGHNDYPWSAERYIMRELGGRDAEGNYMSGPEALTAAARKHGYNSIVYGDEAVKFDAEGIRHFDAAFDPTKVGERNILFSNSDQLSLPGIVVAGADERPNRLLPQMKGDRPARKLSQIGTYSKLGEAISEQPMKAGTAQQWLNAFKKGGVKAQEIYWTGMDDWLREQGNRKIPKEEVEAAFKEREVRVFRNIHDESGTPIEGLVEREIESYAENLAYEGVEARRMPVTDEMIEQRIKDLDLSVQEETAQNSLFGWDGFIVARNATGQKGKPVHEDGFATREEAEARIREIAEADIGEQWAIFRKDDDGTDYPMSDDRYESARDAERDFESVIQKYAEDMYEDATPASILADMGESPAERTSNYIDDRPSDGSDYTENVLEVHKDVYARKGSKGRPAVGDGDVHPDSIYDNAPGWTLEEDYGDVLGRGAGRVIHEKQSRWMQEGNKSGFRGGVSQDDLKKLQDVYVDADEAVRAIESDYVTTGRAGSSVYRVRKESLPQHSSAYQISSAAKRQMKAMEGLERDYSRASSDLESSTAHLQKLKTDAPNAPPEFADRYAHAIPEVEREIAIAEAGVKEFGEQLAKARAEFDATFGSVLEKVETLPLMADAAGNLIDSAEAAGLSVQDAVNNWLRTPEGQKHLARQEWEQSYRNALLRRNEAQGKLRDVEKGIEPGPFVMSTSDFTNLAGKNALHRAAQDRRDWIAWSGPERMEDRWRKEGNKDYYGRTIPETMLKLARQHDPEAKIETFYPGDAPQKPKGQFAEEPIASYYEENQGYQSGPNQRDLFPITREQRADVPRHLEWRNAGAYGASTAPITDIEMFVPQGGAFAGQPLYRLIDADGLLIAGDNPAVSTPYSGGPLFRSRETAERAMREINESLERRSNQTRESDEAVIQRWMDDQESSRGFEEGYQGIRLSPEMAESIRRYGFSLFANPEEIAIVSAAMAIAEGGDPSRVRSVNAAFDPARADDADLLASNPADMTLPAFAAAMAQMIDGDGVDTDGGVLPFGMQERKELYPGEDDYFRANPGTAGMAAEDGRVILNPYSQRSEQERAAVARNEAARLQMRQSGVRPSFAITPEQRRSFAGTPYENDEQAMRETIAARIFSGDPSAGDITSEQEAFVRQLQYGNRPDGAPKGRGYFGEMQRPDGSVSSELSIGVDLGSGEMEIPLLVPTLTSEEVYFLTNSEVSPQEIPQQIIDKAIDHARMRIEQGLSPFAD